MKQLKILILQQREWGMNIGHQLAIRLSQDGHMLAAITFKKTTHEFTKNQKNVKYEYIISHDEILNNPEKHDDLNLDEICFKLKINSIWPFVRAMRNLVYSYKDKYYFSFKQNISDENIIIYVKDVYYKLNDLVSKFEPDFIIGPNFVSFPQIIMNMLAKRVGAIMLGVADTKISGQNAFFHSYNFDEGPFIDRIDSLNRSEKESKHTKKAIKYINDFREELISPVYGNYNIREVSVLKKIKNEIIPFVDILNYYKNGKKNKLDKIGVTIDYRTPLIILRDHYTKKKNIYYVNKREYYEIDKLGRYVYLPLQVQPEATIDVLSPYFSNQIELARLIALSLPGDTTLVVKEHPLMLDKRSPSFHDKLSRMPNVKLVDYHVSNEKLIKNSRLIIAAGATVLAEAAFYYIPCIQLGNTGTTLKLPNVFQHTDMPTLSRKIIEVINMDLKNNEYEKKLRNYVAACFDMEFNLDYESLYHGVGTKSEMNILYDLYIKEFSRCMNSKMIEKK